MAGKDGRRGFGHARKLPSKRWQASYIGPDLNRHNAATTFITKDAATLWLATEHKLIEADTWTPPAHRRIAAAAARVTLAAYAEDWLARRTLRPRTHAHYRVLLDSRILPALGELEVRSVTPAIIRAWYADLGSGTPTMRAHSYGLLRSILTTAVQDDLLAANPCHLRGAGTAKRVKQVRPATLDELARLVAEMPAKYRLAVLIAAWCALRFGELTELRRKDVDLKNNVLHIRRAVAWVDSKPVVGKPKSDAGIRDVAIPPHLIPAIRDHLCEHAQWGADGLLFPSPQGIQLTSSTLYASYWPARRRAGRPDLRWHDLRHTGAVLAAQSGATLADLMGRLGHSSPAAALRYQHTAAERDAAIAAALSDLARRASSS